MGRSHSVVWLSADSTGPFCPQGLELPLKFGHRRRSRPSPISLGVARDVSHHLLAYVFRNWWVVPTTLPVIHPIVLTIPALLHHSTALCLEYVFKNPTRHRSSPAPLHTPPLTSRYRLHHLRPKETRKVCPTSVQRTVVHDFTALFCGTACLGDRVFAWRSLFQPPSWMPIPFRVYHRHLHSHTHVLFRVDNPLHKLGAF